MLSECLQSHPDFRLYGEIFYLPKDRKLSSDIDIEQFLKSRSDSRAGSFYLFYREQQLSSPDRFVTTEEAFSSFIRSIREKCPSHHKVLDVKYNSIRVPQAPWPGLSQMPFLLQMARDRPWRVLHLTRRDYLGTFISQRLSRSRQVWHVSEGGSIPDEDLKIRIDPKAALRTFDDWHREEADLSTYLKGHKSCLQCDYSELFGPTGDFAPDLLSRFADFFQTENLFDARPKLAKIAKSDYRLSVENWSEVEKALRDSKFQYLLNLED